MFFFLLHLQFRCKRGQWQSSKYIALSSFSHLGSDWECRMGDWCTRMPKLGWFDPQCVWLTLFGVAFMTAPIEHIYAEQILHDKCLPFSPSRVPTFSTNRHHIAYISFVFPCTWFYTGSPIFQPFSHRFHWKRGGGRGLDVQVLQLSAHFTWWHMTEEKTRCTHRPYIQSHWSIPCVVLWNIDE